MTFPPSLATRTVKGRFVTHPDGVAAKGFVRIVLNDFMQGPTDDAFVAPFDRTFRLDGNGAFSTVLPASNDPEWTTSYYRVSIVTISKEADPYTPGSLDETKTIRAALTVPYDGSSPIDLADVLNLPEPTPGESYILLASKGVAGGVASLGSDGKIIADQLPASSGGAVTWDDVQDKPLVFPADPATVSVSYSQVTGKPSTFPPSAHTHPTSEVTGLDTALAGKADATATASALASKADASAMTTALAAKADLVAGVLPLSQLPSISKTTVGLGNVDNTSDANKPVSTAQQTALDLKAPLASPTFTGTVSGVTAAMVGLGNASNTSDANKPVSTAQQAALDLKAPLASPSLTGVPTAPTATAGTSTTQVATTAFVAALDLGYRVLTASETVPGGTPAGTLIFRTAT